MKYKYKIVKVPLPNLGCRVYVIITNDFKTVPNKIFKDARLEERINTEARALHCYRENHSYVFFRANADAGEVAHEMWHVVRHVFEYIGAELENEVVAYNIEYLVSQGVDILKQWARKIK